MPSAVPAPSDLPGCNLEFLFAFCEHIADMCRHCRGVTKPEMNSAVRPFSAQQRIAIQPIDTEQAFVQPVPWLNTNILAVLGFMPESC